MPICKKIESIIDGAVDRCDFSDDTNGDERDGDDYTKIMTGMTTLMEPKKMNMKMIKIMKRITRTKIYIMNLPRRERRIDCKQLVMYSS